MADLLSRVQQAAQAQKQQSAVNELQLKQEFADIITRDVMECGRSSDPARLAELMELLGRNIDWVTSVEDSVRQVIDALEHKRLGPEREAALLLAGAERQKIERENEERREKVMREYNQASYEHSSSGSADNTLKSILNRLPELFVDGDITRFRGNEQKRDRELLARPGVDKKTLALTNEYREAVRDAARKAPAATKHVAD